MSTTDTKVPAKAAKAAAVPDYDTSDSTTVDSDGLSSAVALLKTNLRAGATAFQRAGTFVNMICRASMLARLAITLENGLPDFAGVSAAYKQAIVTVQNTFYDGLDEDTRAALRNAVNTKMQVHIDDAVAQWVLANRQGMPAKSDLSLTGATKKGAKDIDPDRGDTPRLVLDAPDALKSEVLKVFKSADLKPKPGRWGTPLRAATNAKNTQDKVESAPLNISAAAATVAEGGVEIVAASTNVWELCDSFLVASRATFASDSGVNLDQRKAAAANIYHARQVLMAAELTLGGSITDKQESDAIKHRFPREVVTPTEATTTT